MARQPHKRARLQYHEGVPRRITIITGSLAALLVIAIATLVWTRSRAIHHASAAPPALSAPVVTSDLMLSGRVTARNLVSVPAPIDGTLDKYFVDVGAQVFQGQLLGLISNPKLQEAAQKAQSDLDKAQARVTSLTTQQLAAKLEESRAGADQSRARNEVDRLQKLYDRQDGLWKAGATARLAYEKAKKDYEDAKAELDKQDAAARGASAREAQLQQDLEAANRDVAAATEAIEKAKAASAAGEIHSPVDGIVVARQDLAGQIVDPHSDATKDLIKVGADLTMLSVEINDPSAASKIQIGQKAAVRLGAAEVEGIVREITPLILVDFSVPDPVTELGQPAQVIIKF